MRLVRVVQGGIVAGVVTASLVIASSAAFAMPVLIDDFEGRNPMKNRLGSRSSTYVRPPSRVGMSYSPQVRDGQQTTALKLKYDKRADYEGPGSGGWCGYYTVMKEWKGGAQVFLDATEHKAVTFWVKGEVGGEDFKVGLADRLWDQREDSVKVGSITQYLPAGQVTTEWQKASIPLDEFFVDNAQLASISLNFEGDLFPDGGTGTVYIDDITVE